MVVSCYWLIYMDGKTECLFRSRTINAMQKFVKKNRISDRDILEIRHYM